MNRLETTSSSSSLSSIQAPIRIIKRKEIKKLVSPFNITPPPPLTSDFRRVFQTTDQMKNEFVNFLKTIFYQLDEKKVMALMEELLSDPTKSDEAVYKELLAKIQSTKKQFPLLAKLRSLHVLKSGLAKQITDLMKPFDSTQFHDYMEIYDRRYVKTIRHATNAPLDGAVIAVCNQPNVDVVARIEAASILTKYPYNQHVPLNDPECKDPFLQPEQTHQPIGNDVPDNSVDMIACLGGLHHIPAERLEPFTNAMHSKLRPGGVIFVREHHVGEATGVAKLSQENLRAMAAVVHTFVNATDGISWEVESKEIREFKSGSEWVQFLEKHGFKQISSKAHVLKDDPTENALMAFVKEPQNLEELREAISYRKDCSRPKEGTRATWIEWGNVRFSKQYAEYIQNHHSYSFDYVGHLRQHWTHFFHFLKESLNDERVPLINLVFSDNISMNLFILAAATVQCTDGIVRSLPSILLAKLQHGNRWREEGALSALEQFEADYQKEYSSFIDRVPFYMYDYMGKMREMWKVVKGDQGTLTSKIGNFIKAAGFSLNFMAQALISKPIKGIYTAETHLEPDTVKLLIRDPDDELRLLNERWEREKEKEMVKGKDSQYDQQQRIEVIHATADGYKLVSFPRYRPFTKICSFLMETKNLEIMEIGGQDEVSVDLLIEKDRQDPVVDGAKKIYALERLQDESRRRYVTYQVNTSALKNFQKEVGLDSIDYIHE